MSANDLPQVHSKELQAEIKAFQEGRKAGQRDILLALVRRFRARLEVQDFTVQDVIATLETLLEERA